MKKLSKFITEHSKLIVLLSIILLIPAVIGYVNTKVNYDILVYLPSDIDTMKGQEILTDEFNIGAFSFVMVDNMSNHDILTLEDKIKDIDGVNGVVSVADVTDSTIPINMLPSNMTDKITNKDGTVIIVTMEDGTSNERTMNAVNEIRDTVDNASSVSGMTSMVIDTMNLSNSEVVIYVTIAVILCLIVLGFATDSYIIPVLLLGNIGFAIIYNLGSNIFLGDVSYITKAITAVLQLGVTTDFSIFLYHKYEQAKEKNKKHDKKEARNEAICETFKLIEKTKHKVHFPKFKFINNFSTKYYKYIVILFLILLIPAIYGNSNYDVYYKLDKSLPDDLPSSVANSGLAKRYNIISPQIIILDKDIKINEIEELVNDLKSMDGIDLVLAPSLLEKSGISTDILPEDLTNIYKNDLYQIIIINSTYEVASKELNSQVDNVEKLVKKYDKNGIVAGEGALTKDLVTIADHDFKVVNYISIAVIFVIMLIVLKSISLPVILVFAIEMAIFMNLSLSYFTNTSLPFIASIVVGTIQLGATIDYAILMSTKYLELRKKNKDKYECMKETLDLSSVSIITSALCFFCATFGVYVY